VTIGGITKHPTEEWILQIGRNATYASSGCLKQCRYVLHDRDSKFTASFRDTAVGWCQALAASAAESESQRVCGTLGEIC